VEQKERWTAERCGQPTDNNDLEVQRLEESPQRWRGHHNIRQNRMGVTDDNAAVLARGEMRGPVMMSLIRVLTLVLGSYRGTVRFSRELAHVPDDDEHRRED
jgi:hypothetical protein